MQPLPLQEWDESLSAVLDDMSGQPLNVHSLMANHPQLLNAWWNYRNYSVNGGDLAQRDRELVILRVAFHTGAWYEWASHVDRGQQVGLSLEEIERVANGPGAPDWPAKETALLTAVDELINKRAITAATQENLSGYFRANQIMDIIAIHGMYVTLGCMINTWSLELDERVEQRLPDGVSRARFERAVKDQS
jgi:alkylhydroperoxidase family enzyme